MRKVIKDLFAKYQHQAVTQDTLLCLVSLELSVCRPEQLTGIHNTCSDSLASIIPPPKDDTTAKGTETVTEATEDSRSDSAADQCGEIVDRWMMRLRSWIFEPGLQQVELHVSSNNQSGSATTALQTYQAQLLPNSMPGQVCTSCAVLHQDWTLFGVQQAELFTLTYCVDVNFTL
jgi:hypothetical protein